MRALLKDIIQSEQDKKDIIEYARNPRGFILFTGTNGSGKSFAAEAIYNANTPYPLPYYDHDRAYLVNFSELNQMYLNKMFDSEGLRLELKKTKLLVIDDLCANQCNISDTFSNFLYSIVDYRWLEKQELGTVVTTNLNSEEMGKKMGPAFRSRVASGIIKRWDHEDRRQNFNF